MARRKKSAANEDGQQTKDNHTKSVARMRFLISRSLSSSAPARQWTEIHLL